MYFKTSLIGLHTMENEHFGIGIVEMMTAGLITIAHNSGGPKEDIIEHGKTGYLATTAQEYAHWMDVVLESKPESIDQMRKDAYASIQRFSEEEFQVGFLEALAPLFH